jgi:hypothetical protein
MSLQFCDIFGEIDFYPAMISGKGDTFPANCTYSVGRAYQCRMLAVQLNAATSSFLTLVQRRKGKTL